MTEIIPPSSPEKPSSYWESNPQLLEQVRETAQRAYYVDETMVERMSLIFGNYPRVRIEMAQRRGVFNEMSKRQIDTMISMYFTIPPKTSEEMARILRVSPERVGNIVSGISRKLSIVRNRNLKYLDDEMSALRAQEGMDLIRGRQIRKAELGE